jgi:hypothetical protein
MKEDKEFDCHYQNEEGEWFCYVMESKDLEYLEIDQRVLHNGFHAEVIEVTETCRICGQCDVYYPL